MNHFERIAIFTLIENIENQLKGLKTLLAASASSAVGSKSTSIPVPHVDGPELSETDELELEAAIEQARQSEIKRMETAAQTHFSKQWADQTGQTLES